MSVNVRYWAGKEVKLNEIYLDPSSGGSKIRQIWGPVDGKRFLESNASSILGTLT